MKIIGGKLKGRNFFMPKGVRPTQSLIRKAIFDILGQDLSGNSFLELFAGSGSVGLEAISRGASRVVFVENDPRCARIIEQNLELLKVDDPQGVELLAGDSFNTLKYLASRKQRFDIVFLDPPYGRGLAKKALKTLGAYDILHPDSIIMVQHDKHEILPDSEGRICVIRQRKYGGSRLTIYQQAPENT